MKTTRLSRAAALLLSAVLLLGLCACNGQPDDTSAPDSSHASSAGGTTAGGAAGSTDSSGNTGTTTRPDVSSDAPDDSTVPTPPAPSEELPVRDMKGRTFVLAAESWDYVDLEEPWVKELESTYNCKFRNYWYSNSFDTLYSSILSNDPIADILTVNNYRFYQLVSRSFLRDLSSSAYIHPEDSSLYVPAAQKVLTEVDGKAYAILSDYAVRRVLVYNKSLISGADDLQTLSAQGKLTWDKLFEIVQKVSQSGKAGLAGKMYESDVLESFVLAGGGRFYTRNGLDFTYTLDSRETRDALTYVQKLYAAGCIMPMEGNTYLYPQTQFAKGRVGVMIADGWNLSYIASKAKFDWGIVLMPNKDGSQGLIDLSDFECNAIISSTQNPEDVELIFAALEKAKSENGVGKGKKMAQFEDLTSDEASIAVFRSYIDAIDAGRGAVDYRNAIANFYDDGLYDYQEKCLHGDISAQSYLESVGAIYKAKARDFLS